MPAAVLDAIQHRFACHAFAADKPLSADEMAVLLQAGRLAPSAFGLEPWRFIRVTDAPPACRHRACLFRSACRNKRRCLHRHRRPGRRTRPGFGLRARAFRGRSARPGQRSCLSSLSGPLPRRHHRSLGAGPMQLCSGTHPVAGRGHGAGELPDRGIRRRGLDCRLKHSARRNARLVIALGHCNDVEPERLRKPMD